MNEPVPISDDFLRKLIAAAISTKIERPRSRNSWLDLLLSPSNRINTGFKLVPVGVDCFDIETLCSVQPEVMGDIEDMYKHLEGVYEIEKIKFAIVTKEVFEKAYVNNRPVPTGLQCSIIFPPDFSVPTQSVDDLWNSKADLQDEEASGYSNFSQLSRSWDLL